MTELWELFGWRPKVVIAVQEKSWRFNPNFAVFELDFRPGEIVVYDTEQVGPFPIRALDQEKIKA